VGCLFHGSIWKEQVENFQKLYETYSKAQHLVNFINFKICPQKVSKSLKGPKNPWVLETHNDTQQHGGRVFCKNDTPDNAPTHDIVHHAITQANA